MAEAHLRSPNKILQEYAHYYTEKGREWGIRKHVTTQQGQNVRASVFITMHWQRDESKSKSLKIQTLLIPM